MLSPKVKLGELRALAFRLQCESERKIEAAYPKPPQPNLSEHDPAADDLDEETDPGAELLEEIECSGEVSDRFLSFACDRLGIPYIAKWSEPGGPAAVPDFIKEQLYGKPYGPGLIIEYAGKKCLVVDIMIAPPGKAPAGVNDEFAFARAMFDLMAWSALTEIPEGCEFCSLYLVDASLIDFTP